MGYKTVRGGPFQWDVNQPNDSSRTNGDFVTVDGQVLSFCIDLIEYVGSGATYEMEPNIENAPQPTLSDAQDPNGAYPMEAQKAAAVKELWAEHIDDAKRGGVYADAFQLAIWEIIFEEYHPGNPNDYWNVNGYDSGRGDFYWRSDRSGNPNSYIYGTDGYLTLANAWLSRVDGDYTGHLAPELVAWVAPYPEPGVDSARQDQLVQCTPYDNETQQVPEPGTVVNLLGLGLMVGLGGFRRLRWRGRKTIA